MAYTQEDLISVETAILNVGKGQQRVSVTFSNGQSVSYVASRLNDLIKLRHIVSADVNRTANKRSFFRIKATKGL